MMTVAVHNLVQYFRLRWLRYRMYGNHVSRGAVQRVGGLRIEIDEPREFYMQVKDIFSQHIYRFETQNPNPYIIDGGANIGMASLYLKKQYPEAKIRAFEPDPRVASILARNLERNGMSDVEIVPLALAEAAGERAFSAGGVGGHLAEKLPNNTLRVLAHPLSTYLDRDVDLLKLNIEGDEFAVLSEASHSGRLSRVHRMIIEYHGWLHRPQSLGQLLSLIDESGFRYVLHDFDSETNSGSKPPFSIKNTYFILVYAERPRQSK